MNTKRNDNMIKVIDEKRPFDIVLLILNDNFLLKNQGQAILINGKRFNAFSVHGIKNAVAVICPADTDISFTGCVVEAE